MKIGWRLTAVVSLVLLVVSAAVVVWVITSRGFSARGEPNAVEALVAGWLRRLSIPREARTAANPLPRTPEILAQAMEHYADHCAWCHANDGSGGTDVGLGLYPPPPDLRDANTQQLSDGELFYIIHNGIRFTGMPAFGAEDATKDSDSWKLVHFIRHLPDLSEDELRKMNQMNPKSPMQLRMEEEMRELLEGDESSAPHHVH